MAVLPTVKPDPADQAAADFETLVHRDTESIEKWVAESSTAVQRIARRAYASGRIAGQNPRLREGRPPKVTRMAAYVEPPREGWQRVELRPEAPEPSQPRLNIPISRPRRWTWVDAVAVVVVTVIFYFLAARVIDGSPRLPPRDASATIRP